MEDNGSETNSILDLTQKLLDSFAKKDWETYINLVDEKSTSIDPESSNNFIEGLDFYKFYFDLPNGRINKIKENIIQPNLKFYGDIAIICFKRLTQVFTDDNKKSETKSCSETRIWKKVGNNWKLVHSHRSF